MLMNQLLLDVLPRVSKLPSGITIWMAANSILSMVYKRLLYRKSDLLASGSLDLTVAAMGYYAILPTDFVALAEKPKVQELYTDWMAGSVTSYNATTGALVVNVTSSDGSDTIADWNIALAATPGVPSQVIGASTTSLAVGTGSKSLTATVGMALTVGQAVFILPTTLPANLVRKYRYMDPHSLDEDDHEEVDWWEWYGVNADAFEYPAIYPRKYKILGTTIYVRPKPIVSVVLKGRYHAKPTAFTLVTDVIPWNGLFDEVFREGCVRIIQKNLSMPDTDKDFSAFIIREVDTVVNARGALFKDTGRTKRSSFM